MPKLVSPFPFLSFFFGGGGGFIGKIQVAWGGGGSKKNEGNPRGVYKIHIWAITNSSGPPQVMNTDWSLRKLANSKRHDPMNADIRTTYHETLNEYKQLLKKKQEQYRNNTEAIQKRKAK